MDHKRAERRHLQTTTKARSSTVNDSRQVKLFPLISLKKQLRFVVTHFSALFALCPAVLPLLSTHR